MILSDQLIKHLRKVAYVAIPCNNFFFSSSLIPSMISYNFFLEKVTC